MTEATPESMIGENDRRWQPRLVSGDPVSRAVPGLPTHDRPMGDPSPVGPPMPEACPSCDGAWAVAPVRSDFVEGWPGGTAHIVHHWRCTGCGREWKTAVQVPFGES